MRYESEQHDTTRDKKCQGRTEQNRTERKTKAEQNRTEQGRAGQGKSNQIKTTLLTININAHRVLRRYRHAVQYDTKTKYGMSDVKHRPQLKRAGQTIMMSAKWPHNRGGRPRHTRMCECIHSHRYCRVLDKEWSSAWRYNNHSNQTSHTISK